ncbi:hypothetical protein Plhal304r1_c075g0162671 [Plasmopara halstedii]
MLTQKQPDSESIVCSDSSHDHWPKAKEKGWWPAKPALLSELFSQYHGNHGASQNTGKQTWTFYERISMKEGGTHVKLDRAR